MIRNRKIKISLKELQDLKLYSNRIHIMERSSFISLLNSGKLLKASILKNKYVMNYQHEESIKAFIIDFSQIYLTDKQPANFYHICNILFRNLKDQKLKKEIIKNRKKYIDCLQSIFFKKYFGKNITLKEIVEHWLYGTYRHDNKGYKKIINKWKNYSGSFYKFAFLATIVDLFIIMVSLSNIINRILKVNSQ